MRFRKSDLPYKFTVNKSLDEIRSGNELELNQDFIRYKIEMN